MDGYKLLIKRAVFKDIKDIPKEDLERIDERMRALKFDPRPVGCQKLTLEERYRIRSGDYRIIYALDDKERIVRILKIGHRREVYRK
jgi:mRNA interferase RelE/StbE